VDPGLDHTDDAVIFLVLASTLRCDQIWVGGAIVQQLEQTLFRNTIFARGSDESFSVLP
jgi:hypothetical protein